MNSVLDDLKRAAARKWQGDPACQQAGLFARAADELDRLTRELEAARKDAGRLDWFADKEGTNLVSDDGGRWAVSSSGFQPVPEDGGFKEPVAITSFVEPNEWHESVRAAIDAAMSQEK